MKKVKSQQQANIQMKLTSAGTVCPWGHGEDTTDIPRIKTLCQDYNYSMSTVISWFTKHKTNEGGRHFFLS